MTSPCATPTRSRSSWSTKASRGTSETPLPTRSHSTTASQCLPNQTYVQTHVPADYHRTIDMCAYPIRQCGGCLCRNWLTRTRGCARRVGRSSQPQSSSACGRGLMSSSYTSSASAPTVPSVKRSMSKFNTLLRLVVVDLFTHTLTYLQPYIHAYKHAHSPMVTMYSTLNLCDQLWRPTREQALVT